MKTAEQLQTDYSMICAATGDLRFKIKRFEEDLERLDIEARRIDQLYRELTKIPKEEVIENTQETKAP